VPNKNQAYAAGKNLALLHNIGLNFKSDLPRKRNIFSELKRALGKNKIFISGLEGGKEFIKQVEDAIEFGKKDESIKGLIHNDYRPGNVIFKSDTEISGVIDFDWSCNGPIINRTGISIFAKSDINLAQRAKLSLAKLFLDNNCANQKIFSKKIVCRSACKRINRKQT